MSSFVRKIGHQKFIKMILKLKGTVINSKSDSTHIISIEDSMHETDTLPLRHEFCLLLGDFFKIIEHFFFQNQVCVP